MSPGVYITECGRCQTCPANCKFGSNRPFGGSVLGDGMLSFTSCWGLGFPQWKKKRKKDVYGCFKGKIYTEAESIILVVYLGLKCRVVCPSPHSYERQECHVKTPLGQTSPSSNHRARVSMYIGTGAAVLFLHPRKPYNVEQETSLRHANNAWTHAFLQAL